jgi:upstream activation factor subunit UAF30
MPTAQVASSATSRTPASTTMPAQTRFASAAACCQIAARAHAAARRPRHRPQHAGLGPGSSSAAFEPRLLSSWHLTVLTARQSGGGARDRRNPKHGRQYPKLAARDPPCGQSHRSLVEKDYQEVINISRNKPATRKRLSITKHEDNQAYAPNPATSAGDILPPGKTTLRPQKRSHPTWKNPLFGVYDAVHPRGLPAALRVTSTPLNQPKVNLPCPLRKNKPATTTSNIPRPRPPSRPLRPSALANSAVIKPMTPSAELSAIVGAKPSCRAPRCTKKVWESIQKEQAARTPPNKRMVNADAKLKAVAQKAAGVDVRDDQDHQHPPVPDRHRTTAAPWRPATRNARKNPADAGFFIGPSAKRVISESRRFPSAGHPCR